MSNVGNDLMLVKADDGWNIEITLCNYRMHCSPLYIGVPYYDTHTADISISHP